jgi:hypothetical protein
MNLENKTPNSIPGKTSRFETRRAKLLLVLCSIVLTVCLLEIAARLVISKYWIRDPTGGPSRYSAFLGNRTNTRFLGPYPPKAGQFRILILGGSTAASLSSVSDGTLTGAFGRVSSRPVEVINLGQHGHISSQESVMLARYGLRLKPDLIVVLDGANDIVTMTKGIPLGIPYNDSFIQYAVEHPFLNAISAAGRHWGFLNMIRMFKLRQLEITMQSNTEALRQVIQEYLVNHDTMKAMAIGSGAQYAIVLQPYLHLRKNMTKNEQYLPVVATYAYREQFMVRAFHQLHGELLTATIRTNTIFIDGNDAFDSSDDDCFIDEVHLTERGKELLLHFIAGHVLLRNGTY